MHAASFVNFVCVSVQRHMVAEFGGLLTRLSMCGCCSQAFDLASDFLLPCLLALYSNMFDRWYPDMFWLGVRCYAQTLLTGDVGDVMLCVCTVCSHTPDRGSTDMFWQV